MRISNVRRGSSPGHARVLAEIAWEDSDRPPLELFFESDSLSEHDLLAEPEPFVAACAIAAMRHGERRLQVEGPVCPRLASGLEAAMALLVSWYGPPRRLVAIEATDGYRALVPRRPERAAVFITGGIDSLHLLLKNRAQYPPGHPDAFVEGLSVFGHLPPLSDTSRRWNDLALAALRPIVEDARIALTSMRTNIGELEPDRMFLAEESLASALASAAHVSRGRWSRISIASGRGAARLSFRGTHPLLDPLYSSSAVDVFHSGIRFTRFQRFRDLSSWRCAIENLVVCLEFPPAPRLNCEKCEKCVRTMSTLLALGKLDDARLFPTKDVRPEMIGALFLGPLVGDDWIDLLPLLRRSGRDDLVAAIEDKLAEGRRAQRWHDEVGFKGRLRRFDRSYCGGNLLSLHRRVFPSTRG